MNLKTILSSYGNGIWGFIWDPLLWNLCGMVSIYLTFIHFMFSSENECEDGDSSS